VGGKTGGEGSGRVSGEFTGAGVTTAGVTAVMVGIGGESSGTVPFLVGIS